MAGAVVSTICRVHDADDVVPGRICGRTLPCRDHRPAPAIRLLTPAQCLTERARLDGIMVVDPALLERAQLAYEVAAFRDELLGSWQREAFDPRRTVGGGENDARHSGT